MEIAVERSQDCAEFEAELKECAAPAAAGADVFPLRMIL